MKITIDDQIGEMKRELKLRKVVYPRSVAQGKLKVEEMNRRIAILEAVVNTLEAVRDVRKKQGQFEFK